MHIHISELWAFFFFFKEAGVTFILQGGGRKETGRQKDMRERKTERKSWHKTQH